MSAKPCGCDLDCKGGPHFCQVHKEHKDYVQALASDLRDDHPFIGPPFVALIGPSAAPSSNVVDIHTYAYPVGTGVLDYFPDALRAVAEVSRLGNDQHNPGEPLHWARGKSNHQADCLISHYMKRGKIDSDGGRHSAKMAWRALALLQLEIEADREAGVNLVMDIRA